MSGVLPDGLLCDRCGEWEAPPGGLCPQCEADDDDEYAYENDDCTMCGGEDYVECDDFIQCTRRHTAGGLCPCGACGGTGLAKDQTVW